MIAITWQDLLSRLSAMPAETWGMLLQLAPYLLLGFLIAGLLSVVLSPATVERHLGGRGVWPVLKGAGLGVPMPLCSCGVIPVSASLRRHGASRGATIAFLIATPQTGVDNIAVTYGMLGGVFAAFSAIATFVSGLIGGLLVDLGIRRSAESPHRQGASCNDPCCAPAAAKHGKVRRAFAYGFGTLPRDLAKSLLLGLAIAAVISALIPPDFFRGSFGGVLAGGILGILVMMAMGIPIYVCSTASVPMVWALIDKGISPGAAFAFLLTGPATNAATIAMVWKVMGPRTAFIYLATIAGSAFAGGLVLNALLPAGWTPPAMPASAHHHMAMEDGGLNFWFIFQNVCAVALLGLLSLALLRGKVSEQVAAEGADVKGFDIIRIAISGMTCSHCVAAVQQALKQCAGVEKAEVDLAAKLATVSGEGMETQCLKEGIEALGYTVYDISVQPGGSEIGHRHSPPKRA